MKLSCIRISSDILIGKKQDEIFSFLSKKLLGQGVVVQHVITTQNNPNKFLNAYNYSKEDVVIILGEQSSLRNYNIKKQLASFLNIQLEHNDIAKENVTSYFKQQNFPELVESKNEYFLPKNCMVLGDDRITHLQGFIVEKEQTFIFLPDNYELVENVYEKYLFDYFNKKNPIKYNTLTIKTFGIYERDIFSILKDLINNIYKILFIAYPNDLEVALQIRYNSTLDEEIVRQFVAKVYEKLNKYIYADEDVSLSQRVLDILTVNNNKIAIAESTTGGAICANLTQNNNNIYNYIAEAFVCSNKESKIKVLNVSEAIIDKFGEVSVETVYEMAAGLLEKTGTDIVLCSTATVESKNPNDKKISFIAVGNNDGIHVYKNKFIGTKKQVLNQINQTALFYLIKNIKQNDWLFSKTTI